MDMATDYPFPVPHTIGQVFGVTPLWQRLFPGWTPDRNEPLVVGCLERIATQLRCAFINLDYAFDCVPENDYTESVKGALYGMESLIDTLVEVADMAVETLPYDPVMQRWVAEAQGIVESESDGEESPDEQMDERPHTDNLM
jgi:hypothetical protein